MYMASKKTPANAPISKSDFIRSQPASLSTAEVVAKGKEAGIKLNRVLVYKVRAKGKLKKTGAAKKTAMAAKTSASTKSVTSKAAFVRGLPASTPAKDVVAQAKAAGIKLGVSYVYNIRGAAKMAAKKKRAVAKSPAVSPVASAGGSGASARAANLLKAVAAEIGLGPAIDILRSERARVAAVIGG
jgi:hypothetical protein